MRHFQFCIIDQMAHTFMRKYVGKWKHCFNKLFQTIKNKQFKSSLFSLKTTKITNNFDTQK